MENENFLGIYISKETATAVLLSPEQAKPEMLGCFSVSLPERSVESQEQPEDGQTEEHTEEQAEQEQLPTLGELISQGIAKRSLRFGEVSVAIDCGMFTQHNLRSEFTDPKQIAMTVKFDAEEAITIDASQIAVAFEITAVDDAGSDMTVYTADQQEMLDILGDLQKNNLDPIAFEPDISCLARFIDHCFATPEDVYPLYSILSMNSCYMINPSATGNAPVVRSFLLGDGQNKTNVLSREVPVTLAGSSRPADQATNALLLSGVVENIEYEKLAERTGLEIQVLDLAATVHADEGTLGECNSATDFVIAYGAAMSDFKKVAKTDFREDFSPYLGRKRIIQKALRFVSISLTIMMVVVGMYFQWKVIRKSTYISQLNSKGLKDYSAIMKGAKPKAREKMSSRLQREFKGISDKQSGNIDSGSAPAKLMYLLKAFNDLPKSVDLNVESVTISAKTLRVKGDTNSRKSTQELYKSLKEQPGFRIASQNTKQNVNRDVFTVNIEME